MPRIWALALASGCSVATVSPVSLEHRSVLDIETRGMVLSSDGTRGHAGMYGVTCDFRTRSGVVGADYDYPSDEERVQDAIDTSDGDFVSVTSSPGRIHLTDLDRGTSVDLAAPNVVHTRLFADRVAVVRDTRQGCVGEFRSLADATVIAATDLPPSACVEGASVTPDRDAGVLFVATADGVGVWGEEGWDGVGVDADLVAWDGSAGVLYAANVGSSEIRGFGADGVLRWSAAVEGEVRDLDHLGEVGAASVSVGVEDRGAIVILDAITGELRADVATPSAADELVVPASGAILGLVTGSQTHFYEVELSE